MPVVHVGEHAGLVGEAVRDVGQRFVGVVRDERRRHCVVGARGCGEADAAEAGLARISEPECCGD